jgi:hypothetical protein
MSSGTVNATPSDDRGGRAFGLGRRRAFVAAGVLALALAALLVVLLAGGGKSVDAHYGRIPSWLPKIKTPAASRYEVASPQKPILGEEQGYTVQAEMPTGSADITAVGPTFPAYISNYAAEGKWPAGQLVASTFYVTFADVRGTIPLPAKSFQVEDAAYQHIGASFKLKGGGAAPSAIHAGQTVTLEVKTKTLEGQGAIAWSPLGKNALIAWIYQLELD